MSALYPYNRVKALDYAKKWAFDRNPRYYNFDKIGGDCTNFISQVLYAGGCPMNYAKWTGWYYISVNNRAPAWTSANYFKMFLLNNKGPGPVVKRSNLKEIEVGDIIQLNFDSDRIFEHSLIVVDIKEPRTKENIYIAAHTYDRYNYQLSNYTVEDIEYYHILGYRK